MKKVEGMTAVNCMLEEDVVAYLIAKYAITALAVVLVSELARRSTLLGAVLASIPTVSVLAMIWIYVETKDTQRISALSTDIIWLVLPSLVLFVVLPVMLRHGIGFWVSLASSMGATAVGYGVVIFLKGVWKGV